MLFDQLQTLIVFLLLIQAIRYFDLMNPKYITFVRAGYLISQCIQHILSWVIYRIIKKKKEQETKIHVPEPATPFSDKPPAITEMSIEEYDCMKLFELVKQNLFNCAFLFFLHLKFGYIQPLILQAILPLKTFFSTPIVKIHLLGSPVVGNLSRPFPVPKSLFTTLFQNEPEETSETAIVEPTNAEMIEESSEASKSSPSLKVRRRGA